MREAVILDAVRTPVGKRGGMLAGWHPTDLLAETLRTLVRRSQVDPDRIADVIAGCVIQSGEQAGNIARWAALGAGLPDAIPAMTIDRQCGSGQQAVHLAAQGVRSGEYDFALACGVESMSRVDLGPLFSPADGLGPWYGNKALTRYDGNLCAQGPAIEMVAKKWALSREELDSYSAQSHRRAHTATVTGRFADHLVPIETAAGIMTSDEGIRANIDPARMATLAPVFDPDGVTTAANASQISDGAAALLIADRRTAQASGFTPKAVIRTMAVAADDPILQFTAILPAARQALNRACMSIDDIDRFEINEAFAPVPLIFGREFGIDPGKINVNGGSISIGHPLGSTGARLITEMMYELERSDSTFGMVVVCEGGGMANATIVERL